MKSRFVTHDDFKPKYSGSKCFTKEQEGINYTKLNTLKVNDELDEIDRAEYNKYLEHIENIPDIDFPDIESEPNITLGPDDDFYGRDEYIKERQRNRA